MEGSAKENGTSICSLIPWDLYALQAKISHAPFLILQGFFFSGPSFSSWSKISSNFRLPFAAASARSRGREGRGKGREVKREGEREREREGRKKGREEGRKGRKFRV